MNRPVLVLCAHGTADLAGQQTTAEIARRVGAARPDLQVELTYVDVQEPKVAEVVARAAVIAPTVTVVPLLLATGYHVQVDIAAAVGPHENARSTVPLGPDPTLTEILADRLDHVGLAADDVVVLAAAGSSRAEAREAPEQAARELAQRLDRPVTIGYGASARPSVPDAVRAARGPAGRVVVAAYLLAPGYFHDRLGESGADVVTDPIGADPRLADIVLRRYDG